MHAGCRNHWKILLSILFKSTVRLWQLIGDVGHKQMECNVYSNRNIHLVLLSSLKKPSFRKVINKLAAVAVAASHLTKQYETPSG